MGVGGGSGWQTGAVTGWGGWVTLPSTQCLKASEEKAVERTVADADGREGVTECVRDYVCPSVMDYDCQV